MREIKPSEVDTIKTTDKTTVLLIWNENCGICLETKPKFQEMSYGYNEMDFITMQLNNEESYNFYSSFVEKEKVKSPSFDEDGDAILDAKGDQIERFHLDENGAIIEKAPIRVPLIFVFNKTVIDEENEFGYLGTVEGYNLPQLQQILTAIKTGQIDDQEEDEEIHE